MSSHAAPKYRKLEIVPGGQSPIRGRRRAWRVKSAEEMRFEREVREAFVDLATRHGRRPSEAWQKVCEGIQLPQSIFGRRITEAAKDNCSYEDLRAFGERMAQVVIAYIDSLFGESESADGVAHSQRVA